MKSGNRWRVAVVLAAFLAMFALAGCVQATYVNWQGIDPTRLADDDANRKWNAYRFETFGPYPDQRIGYVLFGDNVVVDVWQLPYVNLGKMSLREIETDHDAYLRFRMWPGTVLAVHEFRRDGAVFAYTASEAKLEVDLWEKAAEGSKLYLQLIIIDRRPFSAGETAPLPNLR
jgi:hypothetical protein